jgi:hypothetical protein
MQEMGLFSDPSGIFGILGTFHSALWRHLKFWKGLKTDLSPVHNAHESEKFPFSHCNLPKFEVGKNRPFLVMKFLKFILRCNNFAQGLPYLNLSFGTNNILEKFKHFNIIPCVKWKIISS